MSKLYMDYGTISRTIDLFTRTPKVEVNLMRKGQVYNITHDGEGNSLSFINKAYISFTYGGKKIEDFNLIAITISDRIDREMAPEHEDDVTEYKMLNGQYYWGTHYKARELAITLATDGMTQEDLDNFKNWFRAGLIRELILSLHPNRGILARIASSPKISVFPFKITKTVIINELEKKIPTALYKGNIQVLFVMDEPFWYSLKNMLGLVEKDEYGYPHLVNKWYDANGKESNELGDDGYKVVILDHIPTAEMISDSINVSDGIKIIPDLKYKYTLTDTFIEDENNEFLHGTPIVNEGIYYPGVDLAKVDENRVEELGIIETGIYPIAGAVTGPIYYDLFADLELTKFKPEWFVNQVKINTVGKAEYSVNKNDYSLIRYIPVKAGSTIRMSQAESPVLVRISLYDINNKKNLQEQIILSQYTFEQDCYIRLYINFNEDVISKDINDYIIMHINVANSLGNTICKPGSTKVINSLELVKLLSNKSLDYFDGITIVDYLNHVVTQDFLSAKQGSKIIINDDNIQINLFIYNLNKELKKIIEPMPKLYIIENDCYIRLDIIVTNLTIKQIKEKITLCLLPVYTENNVLYYYYAGNAPSYPKINFSVPIHFNALGYIDSFNNLYVKTLEGDNYNTLTLESEFSHLLKLTAPNIFLSYNKVINILKNNKILQMDISSLIQMFRLLINNPTIRNWVINCINVYQHTYNSQENITDTNKLLVLNLLMRNMLLAYMPYVFASYKDSSIIQQDEAPESIYESTAILINYSSETLAALTEAYEYKVVPYQSITSGILDKILLKVLTKNVLTYRWQWSLDQVHWYFMTDKNNWSGSNTDTLRCSRPGKEDLRYYRCFVSNNLSSSLFSTVIKVILNNKELSFLSFPPAIITPKLKDTVTLTWRATNFLAEKVNFRYKIGNNSWITMNPNSLPNSIQNFTTNIALGEISCSFIVNDKNLENYAISVSIGNKWKTSIYAENNEEYLNGTQVYVQYLQMLPTLICQYRDSDLAEWINYDCTNLQSSDYLPSNRMIRLIATGIKNADNLYYQIQGNNFINYTNITTTGFNNHTVFIETLDSHNNDGTINFILRWNTSINDNNYYFRVLALALNNTSIITSSINIPNILDEVSPFLPITVSGYSSDTHIINNNKIQAFSGETLHLRPNESNYNVYYEWSYRSNSNNGWQIISNATNKLYTDNSLAISDTGDYSVKIYRNGENVASPWDKNTYITILVKNRIQILASPQSLSLVRYDDKMNQINPTITFSCKASNFTTYQWYAEIVENDEVQLYLLNDDDNEIQIVQQSNGQITITLNKYSYSELNNIHFFCRFSNGYDNYFVDTEKASQPTKYDVYTYITNILGKTGTDFWTWPVVANTDEVDEVESTYVHWYCNHLGGSTWLFKGMCPPSTSKGETYHGLYVLNYDTNEPYPKNHDYTLNAWSRYGTHVSRKLIGVVDANDETDSELLLLQIKPEIYVPTGKLNLFDIRIFYHSDYYNLAPPSNEYVSLPIGEFTTIPSNRIRYHHKFGLYVMPYYNKVWSNVWDLDADIEPDNAPVVFDRISGLVIDGKTLTKDERAFYAFSARCKKQLDGIRIRFTILAKWDSLVTGRMATRATLRNLFVNSDNVENDENNFQSSNINITQNIPISIDCATGQSSISYIYNKINWPDAILSNLNDPKEICYLSSLRYGEENIADENAGDMILYNNFIFTEQNHFNYYTGKVDTWNENDKTLCHRVIYDGSIPLQQFNINYKNYYL